MSDRDVQAGDGPAMEATDVARDKPRDVAPGRYTNTDRDGKQLFPKVPGRRSATELLPEASSASVVEPRNDASEPAAAPRDVNHAGYGAGAGGAHPSSHATSSDGASGTPAARATRDNFEVHNWQATRNTRPDSGSLQGMQTGVMSAGIDAHADVRARTPDARSYSVGFVQTLHQSTRRAIYADGDGRVLNTFVATRGRVLDQRTDISSPVPWYNQGVRLGESSQNARMTDNPVWVIPTYSPEFGMPSRLEGSESFTTYLVVMVGNDSSTIVYLGNVQWHVNWQGRFDENLRFSGQDVGIGPAVDSAEGGAVLSGPPANAGSMGEFVGATARRAPSRRGGGAHGRSGAYASAPYDRSAYAASAFGPRTAYAQSAFGSSAYGNEAPAPAVDPLQEQLRERRAAIDSGWLPLLTAAEADASEPSVTRFKAGVYRRMVTEASAPTTVPAVLAYLGIDPAKRALSVAASAARDASNTDRPHITALQRATAQFLGGGAVAETSTAFMIEYPPITTLGRTYIREREPAPQAWVTALDVYSQRSAQEDGERLASGGGPARTATAQALLRILRGEGTGVFHAAPDAPPATGAAGSTPPAQPAAAAALTPTQQAQLDGLRRRIIELCPEPRAGEHEPRRVDYQALERLTTDLRAADPAVKDRLTADVELTRRMQSSLTGWNMQSVVTAMDSVEGLRVALGQPLPQGRTQYDLIREYLEARHGAGPDDVTAREGRMRVINNAEIAGIIAGFAAEQHQTILRLAARGTTAADPIDAVYDAARGTGTAEAALRGLMQMSTARQRLDELQANPLFRDAIQHLQTPATVDDLTTSPYDYMMRLWGLDPRETVDPAAARPGEVNPNPGDTAPLSPADWRAIDELFHATVESLAGRLARPSVLLFTDSWTSDSAVVGILTTFENACAQEHMRDLLRRGHLVPGQELTQRANADSRIGDIRERLHRCVGEDSRQICERVLSIRIDAAAVGQIGGAVRTAQDGIGAPDGTRHVPIEQALREVIIDGMTLTQKVRATAVTIAESLATHWYRATRRDPQDILNAWVLYERQVRSKRQELSQLTGIAELDIHPIEFLVNSFREVPNGGDLATRITTCVEEGRVQAVLTDFGLQRSQIAERAVRHGAPPPEATPADRFGQAATQLWQAITQASVPMHNGSFSPAPLQNIATKFSSATQVAAAPAASSDQAPRTVEGPLPGVQMPARVDGNSDSPTTFAGYYRSTYGIEADRHVVEFGRSYLRAAAAHRESILHPRGVQGYPRDPTPEERAAAETWNLTPQQIATFLHVDAAQFSAAVAAPAERAVVTDAGTVATGFTAETAESSARTIWDQLHGRGDTVLIRDQINARRPEEVRLINIEFRRLSGGIDLAFYLRQGAEHAGLGVGADGVREAGQATAQQHVLVLGDTGSMIETADLAQGGRVAILTRMRNAIARSDRSELYRVVGDATPAEKRQILGDSATMDNLRQRLSEVEFDRVFADLNGTLDLAGMLWSHSSEASTSGTTDIEGMRTDIRNYMERRREFHTQALERGGGEVDQLEVERRVREDAQHAYSNPSVRAVIETECRSLFRSGPNSDAHSLTGSIINAGTDPGTGALTGNNWSNVDELVTAIRAMQPAARAQWRNDPEFWIRVDALSPSQTQRGEITAALNGTETSGNDHLGIIRNGLENTTGETEITEALAHLSAEEIRRLQGDPQLVARLNGRFANNEPVRAILTAILGTRHGAEAAAAIGAQQRRDADDHPMVDARGNPIYELPNVAGTIPPAELERIESLKTNAITRMRYGADRSWEQLLREAVEVYRMDFQLHLTPPPPAAQAATATAPAPAAAVRPPLDRRSGNDERARSYRTTVWQTISAVIRSKADNETKHETIHQAVMGEQDPSATLMREFIGGNDSEADIEATIRGVSNEMIVSTWSSVRHLKYIGLDDGDASYLDVYHRYKTLRDQQQHQASATTPAPVNPELERARVAFQRYRIEPSAGFERLLLPYAGNDTFDDVTGRPDARRFRTTRDQELRRDNPEWHRWRDLLLERINGLSADEKVRGLEAESDPDARAIVGSRLATAEQSFQRAQEDHAFQRGDGNSFFGDEHGRELDRAFGDYGTALGQGEDDVRRRQAQSGGSQDLTDAQGRALGRYDARYSERSADYTHAREEAAHWAGLVVAGVIGAAVTALTAGAGSVAMVAMWGALTGAAAATGDTITHEMILGRTYDASGDGLRNIAQGAVTGMVTAGAQFYAGQIIRSLSGLAAETSGTALQQATRVAGVAEQSAPTWRTMLQQAGHASVTAGVQTGLTGFANAAGTLLSPDVWIHGWDEGWVRAQQRISAELRAIPLNVLRTSVSTMLANLRAPGGEHAGQAALQAGERIGPERVLSEIASQLPTNLRQGLIDTALQGNTAPGALAAGAGESALGGIRDVGMGLHDGSAVQARATRFAQREVLAHATEFANRAEAEHYIRVVIDGQQVGAREFLTAREAVARAYMNGGGQPLSEAQQSAFLRWCREAPSPEEFRERMRTNPHDIDAVRTAGSTLGGPATEPIPSSSTAAATTTTAPATVDPQSPVGQARTRSSAAREAFEHVRGASEAALRAEDAYHQNPSAEAGQRALGEIVAARTQAMEQVALAQAAVDALTQMLTNPAPSDRAAIERELTTAREHLTNALAQRSVIELTRRAVEQEVHPTATQHADPAPTPHPEGTPQLPAREQMPRLEDMSPESSMLLQYMIRQHGQERGLHEWRNLQEGRTAEGMEINATIVPGSDFIGTGRATPEPAAVLARGNAELPSLAGMFSANITSIAAAGTNRYAVTLAGGRTIHIILATVHLSYVQVARSSVNTQRGEHTIFLSDRVADTEIRRALVHELGEILAETRSAAAGVAPASQNVLHGQAHTPGPLSGHDWGRVAELNLLAQDIANPSTDPARVLRLRREVGALINELGLRDGTAGSTQRRQVLADEHALSPEAARLMFDPENGLGRPRDALPEADRNALADVDATRASRDQAQLAAAEARGEHPLDPLQPRPDQLVAGRVPLAIQEQIAREAAQARHEKSEHTLRELRAMPDPKTISIPVWVGGGAAVAGLHSMMLFIDARGRWQADQSPELAQTAQQIQSLREHGSGDPHQFAAPDQRVPMYAIRAFEDNLAAQAMVVNGTATMTVGADGRVRLTITPSEGASDRTPVTIVVDGPLTTAPGVTLERAPGESFPIPGATRRELYSAPPHASISTISGRLRALGHDPVALFGSRTGQTDADAAQIGRIINEALARGDAWAVQLAADPDSQLPLRSLRGTTEFEGAFEADRASGQTRILRGDAATKYTGYATSPNRRYVIAGTGGNAISDAEVILLGTRMPASGTPVDAERPRERALGRVEVHLYGRDSAAGLQENTQWRALEAQFGASAPNPDDRGRLVIHTVAAIDGLTTAADGSATGLRIHEVGAAAESTVAGDTVVAALGGRGVMPAMIESYVLQAHRDQENGVAGVTVQARTLWGRDVPPDPSVPIDPSNPPGQYLGYRITVTRDGRSQEFNVTGAQSRTLPVELFPNATIRTMVTNAGNAETPASSGSFAPGMVASAGQARAYTARGIDNTMYTMDPAGTWR